MAADADTTSADVLGSANSGASGGNCHSWAEGNKFTSGLASARACTLRYLGPKRFTNADEIMAGFVAGACSGDEEAAKR